jgi:rhamnogalacturonyl hydrolase YesR
MNKLMQHPDDTSPAAKPLWWWCDGLFMAPPVLAALSQATGNRQYIDFMDRQWSVTSGKLFDHNQHLFFRDFRFLDRHEPNGKSLFWARGNGWVMGGLVRVLQAMPLDYPSRPFYVTQLQEMSTALIALQRPDGLWSAGLLDPVGHPMPETSGSSLITYGITYGINQGLLDRKVFGPHVYRAWEGIVSHIYQDGRLGAVQPVADSPGMFKPTSSYVYGVGAFLLAGSEIYKMADE